jgi:hypothetical protein
MPSAHVVESWFVVGSAHSFALASFRNGCTAAHPRGAPARATRIWDGGNRGCRSRSGVADRAVKGRKYRENKLHREGMLVRVRVQPYLPLRLD